MTGRYILPILALLALMTGLFSGCAAGTQDWIYDDLPKDYSIWRTNSRSISLCKKQNDGLGEEVIASYICEIAYDQSYIYAKQVAVPENLRKEIDVSNPNYFVVIVEVDEVLGPYSEEAFHEKLEKLSIFNAPEWIVSTKLGDKK